MTFALAVKWIWIKFVFGFNNFLQNFATDKNKSLAESFYSVKYGSSIITSNVRQIISVMKTKILVFPKKLYFKNSSFLFTLCLETFILDYWEKIWTENQQLFDRIIKVTLFDGVKELDSCT